MGFEYMAWLEIITILKDGMYLVIHAVISTVVYIDRRWK